VKFSFWPFRRKKVIKENPESAAQPEEKTVLTEVELEEVADSKLSKIQSPESLPILGVAGGWNTMRLGRPDGKPGIVPFEEKLEVTGSGDKFKSLIETGDFTSHLGGLSSFNISEILDGRNEAPGSLGELPTLKDGLTDILARPGSLPEQLPGMMGIAPILPVPPPEINRRVVEHSVAETESLPQPGKTRAPGPPLPEIGTISYERNQQKNEPANNPAGPLLVDPGLSNLISFTGHSAQRLELNQSDSSVNIFRGIDTILPASESLPIAINSETSEKLLINSFTTGAQPETSNEEIIHGPSALTSPYLEGLSEFYAGPTVFGSIQMEKEGSEPASDNISTPLEIQQEVGKSNIARKVQPVGEQPPEIGPTSLVYLDQSPILVGDEQNDLPSRRIKPNQSENLPSQIGVGSTIAENPLGIIGRTEENKAIRINQQPIQLVSAVQNLVLRQSRPPEEMIFSMPVGEGESESGQSSPSSSNLPALDSSERQELNPLDENNIGSTPLIHSIGRVIERTTDQENPVRQVLQAQEFGNFAEGISQSNTPSSSINRIGQSISRFAIPTQIPGMSMLQNIVRNTAEGVNQEMQTVQSGGMPLIDQGLRSAGETALGGGLPQMTLPPTIGETMANLNPVSGNIGQNLSELASNAASQVEQSEIPQMPSIDRLTDQIWKQIQHRLQIERERSRGMS
jgi:hypothetical protein